MTIKFVTRRVNAPADLFEPGGALAGFRRLGVEHGSSAKAAGLLKELGAKRYLLGELPDGRWAMLDYDDMHRYTVEETT